MKSFLFSFEGEFDRTDWWLSRVPVVTGFAIATLISNNLHPKSSEGDLILLALLLTLTIASGWIDCATTAKRYHDRNKSGWWVLVGFIPVVGGIWRLVECGFLEGKPRASNYKANNATDTIKWQFSELKSDI